MENQTNGNLFRQDEIVVLTHWDKKLDSWVNTVYPKLGGRLRLAHEENDQLSIETEVVKYDETIAVVKAVSTTGKGSFSGIGMASTERDAKIAPAILELAESRAIARSLRFAGFGVEHCGAEEISHLQNGGARPEAISPEPAGQKPPEPTRPEQNGASNGHGNGGGNGSPRITNKQLNYLVNLGKNLGLDSKALDTESVKTFGSKMAFLSTRDASAFIDALKAKSH